MTCVVVMPFDNTQLTVCSCAVSIMLQPVGSCICLRLISVTIHVVGDEVS